MKRNVMFGVVLLLTGSLIAAESNPKEDVTAAAKKLAGAGGYSWKTTQDMGPSSPFTPGPTEGKTDKAGLIWLSSTFNDNTSIGLSKGTNVVIKTDAGWQTAAEATGDGDGGFNPATFMVRRMQNLKAPVAEIEDLVAKVKEIKKDGTTYSGDLTEDGAKALLSSGFGRRGGQQPRAATDAKGSVKFWLKDGALVKYEFKVSGKREFNGETREIERTTTTEIKEVGTTKLEVPDEAKKKLP